MRRYLRSRVLTVVLGGAMLLTVNGMPTPAGAHEFEATRRISIDRSPGGTVNRGTRVRFFGRIRSSQHSCRNFELVELVRQGKGVVARDISNRFGKYSMTKRVWRTGNYFSRVVTTISGTHPHRHVCLADQSRVIRVRTG